MSSLPLFLDVLVGPGGREYIEPFLVEGWEGREQCGFFAMLAFIPAFPNIVPTTVATKYLLAEGRCNIETRRRGQPPSPPQSALYTTFRKRFFFYVERGTSKDVVTALSQALLLEI